MIKQKYHAITFNPTQYHSRQDCKWKMKNTEGKRFRWKSYHSETTKPIRTMLKVDTTDKEDTDWMTAAEFPATFSQFKEGSQWINESKALEWLDSKVKTKEFDISNDERPKLERIGDY